TRIPDAAPQAAPPRLQRGSRLRPGRPTPSQRHATSRLRAEFRPARALREACAAPPPGAPPRAALSEPRLAPSRYSIHRESCAPPPTSRAEPKTGSVIPEVDTISRKSLL